MMNKGTNDNDNMYAIKESHLQVVLENLAQYPYKDIHVVMLILENLPKINVEEIKQTENKEELLEE